MAFTKESNQRNTAKSIEAAMMKWSRKARVAKELGDTVEHDRCKEGLRKLIRKWC